MNVPRKMLAPIGAAVLAFVALGVFLWMNASAKDGLAPIFANPAPKVAATEQARVRAGVPEPTPVVFEPSSVDSTDSNNPAPPPLRTPVAPEVVARRYDEIRKLAESSRDVLQKQIDADPELSDILKAKLKALETPLQYITYAQALDDPLLRPAMLELLADDRTFVIGFINITAEKVGLRKPNTHQQQSAEQTASLLKNLEPHFQAEYDRLAGKMEVDADLAQAFVPQQASDVIYNVVVRYMAKRGWNYSVDRKRFEVRKRP